LCFLVSLEAAERSKPVGRQQRLSKPGGRTEEGKRYPEIGQIGEGAYPEIGQTGERAYPEIGQIGERAYPEIGQIGERAYPEIGQIGEGAYPEIGQQTSCKRRGREDVESLWKGDASMGKRMGEGRRRGGEGRQKSDIVDPVRKEDRKHQACAEPPAPADPLPPGPLLPSLRVKGCHCFLAPRFWFFLTPLR
jgi:hypothetical protein